jgi:hypothetical protein
MLTQLGIAAALLAIVGFGGPCGAQESRDGLTQGDDPGAYHGGYLSWAGKTPTRAPAPRSVRQAPPPRYAPAPQYRPAPAPEADVGPEAAPPPAYAPQADAQPQPRSLAQGGAASTGTTHAGSTSVRFYSLHRAYGLTPDPVETPAQRPMVLIGPPDHATAQSQDDGDDGDKPAQHGDGKDDGQSGGQGDGSTLSGGVQGGGA